MKNSSKCLSYAALIVVFAMLPGCEKDDPACCDPVAADAATAKQRIVIKPDTLFIDIPQKDGTKRRIVWFIDHDPTDDFP